jgi:hypothetical protein
MEITLTLIVWLALSDPRELQREEKLLDLPEGTTMEVCVQAYVPIVLNAARESFGRRLVRAVAICEAPPEGVTS